MNMRVCVERTPAGITVVNSCHSYHHKNLFKVIEAFKNADIMQFICSPPERWQVTIDAESTSSTVNEEMNYITAELSLNQQLNSNNITLSRVFVCSLWES